MWQKTDGGEMTFEKALVYADTLTLGGFTDWRLPNVKELQSLNDESLVAPSLDTNSFPAATTP